MPDLKSILLAYLAEAAEVEGDTRFGWESMRKALEKGIAVCDKRIAEFMGEEDAATVEALTHDSACRCQDCEALLTAGSAPEGFDMNTMVHKLMGFGMADTADRL